MLAPSSFLLAAVLASALLLSAGPSRADVLSPTTAPEALRPHAVYLELLGKGGLWGVGYDRSLGERFAAGAAASYAFSAGEQVLSVSPYLSAYPLTRGSHRWFVQAGPQVTRVTVRSPVPEWSGMSTTRLSAEVGAGYEYRARLLVRAYAMGAAGAGGISPWLGFGLGWTFR